MKLLPMVNGEYSTSAGTTELEYGRYASDRLTEVQRFQVVNLESRQRIENLLKKLIGRIDADGLSAFLCHREDERLVTLGHFNLASHFREPDEATLFAGIAFREFNRFIQPIESNGFVIGYLAVMISEEHFSDLVRELAGTYAEIVAHELQLSAKRSSLEKASARLQKKKKELEKAQEYNNNLLSITTHDLSSPLNAVSGYLDMMNDCLHESKIQKVENYHRRVKSGVRDVMDMLKQLSSISKIERGTMSINMVDLNVCWLVREVCELFEGKAVEKDIDFQPQLPDQPVYVKADIVKLRRVVNNLITNAIKYTENEGQVKVQVDYNSDWALIKVADNGKGIPESHYSNIFAPFVKLEETDHHTSSGLGLYVASYFTDLMNGDISVESQENIGSTFTLSLPLRKINS